MSEQMDKSPHTEESVRGYQLVYIPSDPVLVWAQFLALRESPTWYMNVGGFALALTAHAGGARLGQS